ncbi:MAG: transposase [Desulfofustis sp. PB-SRB1]|nr:transposase [Desulfofustis sp. PB-SRB1]
MVRLRYSTLTRGLIYQYGFTKVLTDAKIAISMDGRGRALDNIFVERLWRSVKYEDIYLKGYEFFAELYRGLRAYFTFYNDERPHQALGYLTPASVYRAGTGGGGNKGSFQHG